MSAARPPVSVPAGIQVGPLGFVLRDGNEGRSVWEYRVDPAHFNPNGTLHGGVMMALLDTAMGFAVVARVAAEGRINAAAEQSTRFLAPVRGGLVTAEATVLKIGKRLAIVEARATDESGNLVAVASATHTLLP
ncbi:MAG TPA: PaaI family thioesterase [Polyangia bacterium]|nr:PaaI family thioesterase [Polyangia bacterium]